MLFRGSDSVRWGELARAAVAGAVAGVRRHRDGVSADRWTGLCQPFPLRRRRHALASLAVRGANRRNRSDRRPRVILSKVGLPKNLDTVVEGKSLLNDGVAVVLFTIFASTAIGSSLGAACAAAVIDVIASGSDVAAPMNSAPATTSPMPVQSASSSATPESLVSVNAIAAALATTTPTVAQTKSSATAAIVARA